MRHTTSRIDVNIVHVQWNTCSAAYLAYQLRVERSLRTFRSHVFDRKYALLSSGACSARKTESFALKIRANGQNPAEIRACTKK